MNILLVNPRTPDTFWSFRHVLPFVARRASMPPLGLLTVAALLPREWTLKLVDLNVEPLADATIRQADYVLLSAMLVQQDSALEVAARCRALGRPVIAGGPLFTTATTPFPDIPHVVRGEAEELMPQLVADMEAGRVRPEYRASRWPDLRLSPVPRWDLVRLRDYVTMAVQFSRGCPFDCEFCDIIVMNGRVPRTKTPGQVIAELETLRRLGWRDRVFVVDDNFIGDRRRTRALLEALLAWRQATGARMEFLTEASINLADDADLCARMVAAGFKKVFVGLETPAAESLEECRKHQNRGDLVAAVQRLQRAGLEVMGGFIVGFDHDPHDIFQRQFEFIQRSGVVTAMVGLLTALPQTRLWQRLRREGRLRAESLGNNTAAVLNFEPRLGLDYLVQGYRELMKRLYEPRHYYQRIRTFLREHRPAGPRLRRLSRADLRAFVRALWVLGLRQRGRLAWWRLVWGALLRHPRQFQHAMELAILGYHFRRVAQTLEVPAPRRGGPQGGNNITSVC